MVILNPVDPEGDEGHELSPEVEDWIQKLGPRIMLSVVTQAITNAFTRMSVNPEVVGIDVSEFLAGWRRDVIWLLVVFKDHLLPLSRRRVNELQQTLRTYFLDTTFDEFKTLLPNLKTRLQPRIRDARDSKSQFMVLGADLTLLKVTTNEKLEPIMRELEKARTEKGNHATKSKKAAKRMKTFGTVASYSSVLGSVAVAKSLMTVGGVMFAANPVLAPFVIPVGIAIAAITKDEAKSSAKRHEKNAEKCNAAYKELSHTVAAVQHIKNGCIDRFADCLEGCVGFFSHIETELEQLSSPDCEGTDPDEILEIFLRKMRKQARHLNWALTKFQSETNRVESAIQVIDKYKPEDCEEFKADWIKKAKL